jgi:hypothetical protein
LRPRRHAAIIVSVSDESKGPIDQLADVFVFAPLGFALEARDLWPRLAARGRAELQQVRGHGERVVTRGRDWAGSRVDEAQEQAQSALSGLGLRASDNGSSDEGAPAMPGATAASRPAPVATTRRREPAAAPPFDAERLAIPDYDALSASQVVPRLAGLLTDELELVRQYEAGTRGRKTILNKIAQLQAH